MRTLLNRAGPWCLAGLLLLLTACAEQQAATTPPPPPQVTVRQPVVREVVEWDEYTGRIEAMEFVEVRARVNGYLQSVHFKDGALVKKGALLFVIDPRPYQAEVARAQAELALAQARYERTRKDFARAQKLLQSRAISEEEIDTRAAEQNQAREAVQAARAAVDAVQLNVEFTQVKAPISGRISRNLVTEGNLINGGSAQATLLTTIVSLDPIYCYFEADERAYLKYVRLAQDGKRPSSREVQNPVALALTDETGFPHQGYIDFVENRLDPNTSTMTGRAVIANPNLTLVPGLFARLRLQGSGKYNALLLPDEAVGSDQSQRFVLLVNDQDTVEYRKVEPGPLIDGLRVIRDGLQAADWVVVNGLQRIAPGARVTPQKQESGAPPSPEPNTAAARPQSAARR
jgi:RND family efflux transporter MFP subunit